MKSQEADESIRQRLKVVQLLDCVPGNADSTEGEPITIITLGHDGQVEESMMMSRADTERLVVKLFIALAAHGDQFADHLLDKYFTNDEGT